MIYEKDKIRRLIAYKDEIINETIKNDLEWILGAYNDYFVNNREYEKSFYEKKDLAQKYYNSEEEKETLKEELYILKRKYRMLKDSCGKRKSMI